MMRLGVVWRVLASSAIVGLLLVKWHGENVAPVSIAAVALLLGTERVLARSLTGRSPLTLTRIEMFGIAIPIGIAWLGIGVSDLVGHQSTPWTLVAGGAGLVVSGLIVGRTRRPSTT